VVAAINAAEPKEIPMTKAKSKRQTTSRSDGKKTVGRTREVQTTARKTAKPKPAMQATSSQSRQPAAERTRRPESKRARIIAMLRAPGGATIDAMAHTTGWQQHSVRGFLAGVIRKKLGFNLQSETAEGGRIYRITDRAALPVAAAKTSQAA
jgi:Protein of unknown function (DUF3489)